MVASRLAIEAASADVDAQRAQRAGALQSAVDMHARCERLQQLAGAEDVCMNRAIKQVCWSMSVPNMLGTHIAIQAILTTPSTALQKSSTLEDKFHYFSTLALRTCMNVRMQVEEASRESASLKRDAGKLSEASEALKSASQCLRVTAEALHRLRSTQAHLEQSQQAAAEAATAVSETRAALDAAKLAVVVAEGAVDALEPSGSSIPAIASRNLFNITQRDPENSPEYWDFSIYVGATDTSFIQCWATYGLLCGLI